MLRLRLSVRHGRPSKRRQSLALKSQGHFLLCLLCLFPVSYDWHIVFSSTSSLPILVLPSVSVCYISVMLHNKPSQFSLAYSNKYSFTTYLCTIIYLEFCCFRLSSVEIGFRSVLHIPLWLALKLSSTCSPNKRWEHKIAA